MNKHTMGPWTIGGKESSEVFDTNGNQVAFCVHLRANKPERSVAEATANANLMAAAPDLLEALKLCMDGLHTYAPEYMHGLPKSKYINKAYAAIAKATGEIK